MKRADQKVDSACLTMDALRSAFHSVRKDSKFNELVEKLEKKGYSKAYATKIAGKVAQEKGK